MNIKSLVFTVIETIIKVAVLVLAITYIMKGVTAAYEFGYKVFADRPMSANNGRTITVGIPESATVEDVGEMLEEKGLIEDAKLFKIQEYLSSYHDMIKPGIYDLSTSMTPTEILATISSEETEEEDVDAPSADNEISGEDSSELSDETDGSEMEGLETDEAGAEE